MSSLSPRPAHTRPARPAQRLILASCALALTACTPEFDLVLSGGTVIDGTGAAGYEADVGVRDGLIAEIGRIVRRYNAEHAEDGAPRLAERDVLAMVEDARAKDWCQTANLITEGHGSIATLLPLPRGARPLAVGIGSSFSRLQSRHDELREALMAGVAEFSAATAG